MDCRRIFGDAENFSAVARAGGWGAGTDVIDGWRGDGWKVAAG